MTYTLVTDFKLVKKNSLKHILLSLTSFIGAFSACFYFLLSSLGTEKKKKQNIMQKIEQELKLLADINRIRSEISAFIDANKDDRVKSIGDRVKIWDGSGNVDKVSGIKRDGIDPLFKNIGIVIETNCERTLVPALPWESEKHLDLLIVFPDGEEVYTSSRFVQIID
jgi:hypothetical protein